MSKYLYLLIILSKSAVPYLHPARGGGVYRPRGGGIPCQITTKCGDFIYTPQSPHIVVIVPSCAGWRGVYFISKLQLFSIVWTNI